MDAVWLMDRCSFKTTTTQSAFTCETGPVVSPERTTMAQAELENTLKSDQSDTSKVLSGRWRRMFVLVIRFRG